ncbi:MAG: hypothetical protein JO002_08605 [Burkholderiaceae bacterium]|nr:hypothetical protein [Burkholderiaceae bacterium]
MPITSLNSNDESLLSIVPFSRPAPKRRVMLVTRKQFSRKKAIEALQQAVFRSGLANVSMLEEETALSH